MRHLVSRTCCGLVILALVVSVGCNQSDPPPGTTGGQRPEQEVDTRGVRVSPDSAATNETAAFDGFIVHSPVVHQNLAIFPVSRVEPNLEDRFITLDEGLKNGTIEVFELSAGDSETGSSLDPSADALTPPLPADNSPPAEPAIPPATDSNVAVEAAADPGDPRLQSPFGNDAVGAPQFIDDEVARNLAPATENAGDDSEHVVAGEDFPQMQRSEGNSVNAVYVRNRSDRPLYLMPGEIILGGDQDRTIGEELVIAPSEDPVEVEVFCVEHGRWEGRSVERTLQELEAACCSSVSSTSIAANLPAGGDGTTGSATLDDAALQLSQKAEQGQFIASVGVLTKKARLAAQGEKDQGRVWDEVAAANASAKSQIDSGAFTQNYVEVENIRRFESYIEGLQERVSGTDNVVGVVVAVNGKIDAADVFESTPLFRKLWPKLLKSYALEAANRADEAESSGDTVGLPVGQQGEDAGLAGTADEAEAQDLTCNLQDAIDFLQTARAASETSSDIRDGIATSKHSNESVDSFFLHIDEPASAAAGGLGGGGFGGAVHFSGFSK